MTREGIGFTCGFAPHLEAFARHRLASGSLGRTSLDNLRYFDRHCAQRDPGATSLTQSAIDAWCEVRETETPASCAKRTSIARRFASWANERGLTDAVAPRPPRRRGGSSYAPHAFTRDELARFFDACDSIVPYKDRFASRLRKVQLPALFRLLYSSGMRTTEARMLRRDDVDLSTGVVSVIRSKGPDQHYVVLHPSMLEVMRAYDEAADRLQPGREWLFQSRLGGFYGRRWVESNFRELWGRANGSTEGVCAYQLRNNYATANIGSWDCGPLEQQDRLLWLSKSMGHRSVGSTLRYFSATPALADKLLRLTGDSMDAIVPDVWEA